MDFSSSARGKVVAIWALALAVGALVFLLIRPANAELVPGPVDPRGFRFLSTDATGEPVRYSCEPIRYVVNPALAPPGGVDEVHTAIELTSRATGLRFVYDGPTDEAPAPFRDSYDSDRYGRRWSPVLIAWQPELHTSGDGARIVGLAASNHEFNDKGEAVYVSGQIIFDAGAQLRPGFGGQTSGQVMVHELGHLLGLDHLDDPTSVMNPTMGLRPAAFGKGDRTGLWELGLGSPCLKPPDLP